MTGLYLYLRINYEKPQLPDIIYNLDYLGLPAFSPYKSIFSYFLLCIFSNVSILCFVDQ